MRHPKKTQYGDYATWVMFEVFSNYAVRVILTDDIFKSAKERLNTAPERDADAFCFHVTGVGKSFIFLPMDAAESTVAHECWHVIYHLMHYMGIEDLDNETVAYHLGHLVEKVYDFKKAVKSSTEVKNDQSNSRASRKKRS